MVSGRRPWIRGIARNAHPALCRQCEARVADRRDHRRHRGDDRGGAGHSKDGNVRHASVGRELLECTSASIRGLIALGVPSSRRPRTRDAPARWMWRCRSRRACRDPVSLGPVRRHCRGRPGGLDFNSWRGDGDRGRSSYRSRRLRRDRRSIAGRDHRDRTTCGSFGRTRAVRFGRRPLSRRPFMPSTRTCTNGVSSDLRRSQPGTFPKAR